MKTKVLVAAALFFLACSTQATRMSPLSIEQLTTKADLVLHGTVTSKSVQRDAAGRIYTKIQLQVTDAWKGMPKANPFTMVQGGGVLGEEIATVDGQEEFSIGEEIVAFLVLNERGEGLVIGIVQGRFKVTKDAGGEKVVHNVFHGVAPGQQQGSNEKAKRQPLTLGQLKQRVQGGQR